MNETNETEATSTTTTATEKIRDLRAVESLFNAAALEAVMATCAIIGPKVPPGLGD